MAEDERAERGTDAGDDAKKKEPKDQKRREQVLVAAAVAGVILTVLLLRRGSSAAPQQQQASQFPPGTATLPGSYSGGVASSDFYNLEAQVQGLSSQLSTLQASQGGSSSPTPISSNPTPAPWSSPYAQTQYNAGFGPSKSAIAAGTAESPISGIGGGSFEWLPSGNAVFAASTAGEPIYYQPTPGHFTLIADPAHWPAQNYPETPIFTRNPGT